MKDKDVEYLSSRGIEAIQGEPPEDAKFPYMTIRKTQESPAQYQIMLHRSQGSMHGTSGLPRPQGNEEDLLEGLESHLASARGYEGGSYATQAGEKINVYVVDDAWILLVQELARKYNS